MRCAAPAPFLAHPLAVPIATQQSDTIMQALRTSTSTARRGTALGRASVCLHALSQVPMQPLLPAKAITADKHV